MMENSSNPLVSVVMPAYNMERYIEEAIRSVQAQTMEDWELIVVDDCSADGTCAIVEEMAKKDSRIRLLRNEKNMGVARTRNRGLDASRGSYVALMDSDDLWVPHKLEKQLALAQEEKADIVYCSYAFADQDGNKKCNDFIVPKYADMELMLKKNVIGCSMALLTARTAAQYRFTEGYYHEDYVYWLSMIRDGKKAVGNREVLTVYRLHSDSRAANKLASAKNRWKIYRSFLGMSRVKSLYYLVQYALIGVKKYRSV